MNRRTFLLAGASIALAGAQVGGAVTRYVRFRTGNRTLYGILENEQTIDELKGTLFNGTATGTKHKLSAVKLLYPCQPRTVFAVGLNYKSHLGARKPPSRPEIFYKPVTSLQNPGDPIRIPASAKNVHYEGEFVVVIGKPASRLSRQQAQDAIFGVTCGNDVSERDWQNGSDKDLQWWRAKGADTFAPMGPCIARGLNYGNLLMRTRLNGKEVQKQSTSDLLFDAPAIVSFISQYVSLAPGDVIYTGTPGTTQPMKAGDVVEVEIEGVGVLKNPVA